MDLVTAFTFVIVIAGSLAYTNYKFNAAFKACGSGVKATVAPDVDVTEAEKVPVVATTRLSLSQKRHLLEAASAKKAAERRAAR
jgi:hypothetical protein